MIDFSKITKTTKGLDCHYLGQRTSKGQVLHRFAVFNDTAELICYYNEKGQQIDFSGSVGKWELTGGHQIIAPPKIVEVTRWVALKHSDGLFKDHGDVDDFYVLAYANEPKDDGTLLAYKQHTFRFEVPNDS